MIPSQTLPIHLDLALIEPSTKTLYPTPTQSLLRASAIANRECLQPFSTFAYQGPVDRSFQSEVILPQWQLESQTPPQLAEGLSSQVELVRSSNDTKEVWVSMNTQFGVYRPASRKWTYVSRIVRNTDMIADHLFVTSSGALWGRTNRDWSQEHSVTKGIPVLSKFSESTQEFELVEETAITSLNLALEPIRRPQVLLDDNDTFWIIVEKNGIFHYSPMKHSIERVAELLDDFELSQAVLSQDGSIYLRRFEWAEKNRFRLPKDLLFKLSPATAKLETVTMPNQEWPVFSGMLVDRVGRLWLGSIGYRDVDLTWHLIHPAPQEFFDLVDSGGYSYLWAPPELILESSNGVLWFRRYLDTSGWAEGTAWYNPKTGEGCLFTNQAANVVEDKEEQLWLLVDGKLYKHPLKP